MTSARTEATNIVYLLLEVDLVFVCCVVCLSCQTANNYVGLTSAESALHAVCPGWIDVRPNLLAASEECPHVSLVHLDSVCVGL